jgi:hypothetical protein
VISDDLEALKQLESCGGSTVTDILLGFIRYILGKVQSQRRLAFESMSDQNLYLCMASPFGMLAAQGTVVLSVLQVFESCTPAAWILRMRSVLVVDLLAPVCTVRSAENRVIQQSRAKISGSWHVWRYHGMLTCPSNEYGD